MKLPEKFFAHVLGYLFGAWWLLFGFLEGGIAGLVEGLIFGGTILLFTALAHKYEFFCGCALVLYGVATTFMVAASGLLLGVKSFMYLILSLPPFAAGLLFIIHWHDRIATHRK